MAPPLPSPLGLQDKLNKRDKEVTALTNQTEMLRAQVSGKSPPAGQVWGLSLGPRASGVWRRLAFGSGCPPALCLEEVAAWFGSPVLDFHGQQ